MAEEGKDGRLVERHPILDAVAQGRREQRGVVGEPADDLRVGEAAAVLQRLRQVPVEQVDQRLDARGQQGVDEALVEVEAGLVDGAGPRGQHARPADAEAIGARPQIGHQPDVLRVAVVVVAGDVARAAIGDRARLAGEGVPDRRSPAVLGRCSLDLVGGGGEAPGEVSRKGLGERGRVGVERGRCTHPRIVPASSAARSSRSSSPVDVAVRCADSAAAGGALQAGRPRGAGRRSGCRRMDGPRHAQGSEPRHQARREPRARARCRGTGGPQAAQGSAPHRQARGGRKPRRFKVQPARVSASFSRRASATTGGSAASSTRSTRAASPTRRRRGRRPAGASSTTSTTSAPDGLGVDAIWLSPIYPSPGSTSATTSATTSASIRCSAPRTTSTGSSRRRTGAASGSCSTWS